MGEAIHTSFTQITQVRSPALTFLQTMSDAAKTRQKNINIATGAGLSRIPVESLGSRLETRGDFGGCRVLPRRPAACSRRAALETRRRSQAKKGAKRFFTPGRSTVDRILTLRLLAEKRREFRKPLYAAYVDMKQAFDSVYRNALWLLLKALGVPAKLVHLLSLLYSNTSSRVKVNGLLSDSFVINSGVRQGCVLAPTIFNVAIDHVMGRTVEQCNCGVSFRDFTVTDLDYADDVAILAEVLEVLQLALQAMDTETQPLGLIVSWEKTKVESVERFSYLGGTITSDCRSDADIHLRLRNGRATAAMASLEALIADQT
ncbi:hypothetical protein Bbelb_255630 [Branchiostoma belcheri]|nr:hypothetical protein Bbelb_255630 [Branchiostoma belcheri]